MPQDSSFKKLGSDTIQCLSFAGQGKGEGDQVPGSGVGRGREEHETPFLEEAGDKVNKYAVRTALTALGASAVTKAGNLAWGAFRPELFSGAARFLGQRGIDY